MENSKLQKECKSLLKTLVTMNTSQPRGNELDIIKVIDTLFPADLHRELIDHGGNRASLIVRIDGTEPVRGQALAFVGHVDTVSFGEESHWTHPPLSAQVEGDIMYGRGTSDMKGGLVAMILAAKEVLKRPEKPKQNIYFCFTADEEVGGMGVQSMVKQGTFDDVGEILIPEPTDERLGTCEKGALWLRIRAHGALSHGSRPEVGINAIELLLELKETLQAYILNISGETHPLLNKTTVALTKLNGGVLTNVIPDTAEMELDIRTLPAVSHEEIIKAVKEMMRKLETGDERIHFELTEINNRAPVQTPDNSAILGRMQDILREHGKDGEPRGLYYYTDMSQIGPFYNCPFLIFGPGDDKQAHQLDEHVRLSSVARMAQIYAEYMKRFYF